MTTIDCTSEAQLRGQEGILGKGARNAAQSESKLRGGYYTPAPVAEFLTSWAIQSPAAAVLEPSAGDGAFVRSVGAKIGPRGRVTAVELFAEEASAIRAMGMRNTTVIVGDVFHWYWRDRQDGQFDAVVGNPPFIRYQTFPEDHRTHGFALMTQEGLRPNRLTNAWVPFLVLATRALRENGRLAMVVPAELLQVSYAAELRDYLVRSFAKLFVITFRSLIFEGIQQEAVLLLGERGQGPAEISFVQLDGTADLANGFMKSVTPVRADLDHSREKWTQYYLSPIELALVRELESSAEFTTLGQLAEVDVGIVTGRNEFFVITPSEASRLKVEKHCLRLVGRSAQVPGLVLRDEEWWDLRESDAKCLLLQLGSTSRSQLSSAARRYVEWGEEQGFHEGFKCRIRLPMWWEVPTTWAPDAFLLRQIAEGPRIIVNRAGATCTDTIHRIRVNATVSADWLAAASMNSLTYAFSEIRGRSYGGGVLELEPTEAEGLLFPRPGSELSLDELDLWRRRKETEEILTEVDQVVLRSAGLSKRDIELLRGVWRKLSERRRGRRPKR